MVLRKNLYFATLVIAIGLLLVHHNLQPVQHIDTVDDAGRSFVIGSQGLKTVTYDSPQCACSRQLRVLATSPSIGDIDDSELIHWCSEEATLRGAHQNVVAFSLFGDLNDANLTERYFGALDTIAAQSWHFYPGWRMRIYHNSKQSHMKQHDLLCRIYCKHEHLDLCNIRQLSTTFFGKKTMRNKKMDKSRTPMTGLALWMLNKRMWRYMAMLDPLVDSFMARDSDSEINQREAAAVYQWLASNRTFHVMRDHQGHYASIMGGMFGAKVYRRREVIQALTRAMVEMGSDPNKSHDQKTLANIFWPTVKDDAMIHDSYYCEDDWNSLPATPFPTRRVNGTFVTDRTGADWGRPKKCPLACRPRDHKDWEYC